MTSRQIPVPGNIAGYADICYADICYAAAATVPVSVRAVP